MDHNKINIFSNKIITSLKTKGCSLPYYCFYIKISTLFSIILPSNIYQSYNNSYQNYMIEMGNIIAHNGDVKTDTEFTLLQGIENKYYHIQCVIWIPFPDYLITQKLILTS